MPDIWFDVDAALAEVPVNLMSLIDDTDFKTREEAVVYNQAGLDLQWNFITTAGVFTQTVVTPTTGGVYDWASQNNAMYTIEIPASGGGTINNDTEGFGWFTGFATGVLPWRGPVCGFRAAGLNDLLIDAAYNAPRGLSGTALPAAAADGIGGLPISDAGGLDLDAKLAATNEITAARMGALTDWINGGRLDLLLDAIPTTAMRGTDGANTTTPPTVGAIADQVWDEAQADHVVAGSFGEMAIEVAAIPTTAMRGTDGANTTAPDNTGIVDIQNRIPAALVGGRIDSTVDGTGMEAAAAQVIADRIIPKINTALPNIEFLMIDSADDITPKAGLVVAGTRSIDGGAFGAVTGTIAEVANGIYQFDASAADMNGTIITFRFTSTGANDRFLTIRTSG